MLSVREARDRLGVSQAMLAAVVGVTQPAIAAYEAGRRAPTGDARAMFDKIDAALRGPVRAYGTFRGRPIVLPAAQWRPVVPPDAVVRLPVRIDWSPRRDPNRHLADPKEREATYAQVLENGDPFDIRFWVDPVLLAGSWVTLPLARHMKEPVHTMLATLGYLPCQD